MTLTQLREQAEMSITDLVWLSHVDRRTIHKLEDGKPTRRTKAVIVLRALSRRLGKSPAYTPEEIEGLTLI